MKLINSVVVTLIASSSIKAALIANVSLLNPNEITIEISGAIDDSLGEIPTSTDFLVLQTETGISVPFQFPTNEQGSFSINGSVPSPFLGGALFRPNAIEIVFLGNLPVSYTHLTLPTKA